MSLRELVDGECGQSNPLVGIAGQYLGTNKQEQDLIQRGVLPPGAAGPSQIGSFAEVQAHKLVNEFLTDIKSQQRRARRDDFRNLKAQHRFRMDHLVKDLEETERFKQEHDRRIDTLVTRQNQKEDPHGVVQHKRSEMLKPDWVDEFVGYRESQNEFLPTLIENREAMLLHDSRWADEFLQEKELELSSALPKSGLQDDVSWVDQFANLSIDKKAEMDLADALAGGPDISETEFMKFVNRLQNDEIKIEEDGSISDLKNPEKSVSWAEEFIAGPSGLNNTTPQKLAERWTREFEQKEANPSNRKEGDEEQFWQEMVNAWKEAGIDDGSTLADTWAEEFDFGSESTLTNDQGYRFAEENEYRDLENPLEEGLKMLERGDVPSAVLMFEAAAEKQPDNALAWYHLGTSQQQNEFDSAAIPALSKCLEIEPSNLNAIMALAVSLTNESMQSQACRMLNRWIKTSDQYSHLTEGMPDPIEGEGAAQLSVASIAQRIHRDHVKRLFIQAARLSPSNPDANVQTGLGVLFNLSGEYDKAADCFRAALNVNPTDSLLWNRLGATLANGSKPEEAVAAYREALRLSPGFIRSRFNLGISCVSLNAYQEAVEHFLSVLNSQSAGRGMRGSAKRGLQSGNVWSTLRMVMTLMGRPDLYAAVDNRDLVTLNEQFNMTDYLTQGTPGSGSAEDGAG